MKNNSGKSAYMNMDSYVVHVYRRDLQHPGNIIGIVETIKTRKKDAFKDTVELVSILNQPSHKAKEDNDPEDP